MKSFDEVDDLLIAEYALLMKAENMKKLDRERDLHKLAYLNLSVQSMDRGGKKSAYPTFERFFDYEKLYTEMFEPEKVIKKDNKLSTMIALANKKGG